MRTALGAWLSLAAVPLGAALVVAPFAAACSQGPSHGRDANAGGDANGGGGSDATRVDAPPGVSVHGFRRYTVDPHADGPAYAALATVGGRRAIVVSAFGHPMTRLVGGTVTAYVPAGGLGAWSATPIVAAADGVIFPNQLTVADVDGDGDDDVIVPSGFLVCAFPFLGGSGPCGAIAWYEQTASGWLRHALVTRQDDFYHHVELADLDGDGLTDLVTTGEYQPFGSGAAPRAELQVVHGAAGPDRFGSSVETLAQGGGSFPRVLDLDGDHDLDVASAQYFVRDGSFVWFEHAGATWTRHVVDDRDGPAIELTLVPNLVGDGSLKAIGANHVNTAKAMPDPEESAVLMFDVGSGAWQRHVISDGIVSRPGDPMTPLGAPGIFGVGDLDGDGDLDIAVSGDGDAHVYWLEQTAPGQFATHVIEDQLGQAGGMVIGDVDGDGRAELVVTGYEDNVIYVYAKEHP